MKSKVFKLIFLAVTLFLFTQSNLFAKQPVVIYGDSNYPPYSYLENNKPKGVYVEILEMAFSKMKDYDVTIKCIPWKRGMTYVKNGTAMALFPPYYTKERTPWMLFSEPILEEQVVVFGKAKNLKGKNKWPEDYYGFKFGWNRGFTTVGLGGAKFADACKSKKIKLWEMNGTTDGLKMIKRDWVTFYLNGKLTDISSYPSIKRGPVTATNNGYLGFTRKGQKFPFLTDFKNKFDKIIKEMKTSKEIEKIVNTYLK